MVMKQKPFTKKQLQNLHAATLATVQRFPALAGALAEQLRVSPEAVLAHDIGYYPDRHVWIFPERDEYGEVIGLTTRTMDGKKEPRPFPNCRDINTGNCPYYEEAKEATE